LIYKTDIFVKLFKLNLMPMWLYFFVMYFCGLLKLRFRIQPGAGTPVSCGCCALFDRGLCVGLITRPEES
jgi:hypothetical protein